MKRQEGTLSVLDGNHRIQALQAQEDIALLQAEAQEDNQRIQDDVKRYIEEHARLKAEQKELFAMGGDDMDGDDHQRYMAKHALLQAERDELTTRFQADTARLNAQAEEDIAGRKAAEKQLARLQAEKQEDIARLQAEAQEDIARVKAAEEEIELLQVKIRMRRVCRGCQACMDSQPTP
tara:strand:+ start:80 stop:616 length:537 start_codon:yes stop_codon:yes gene_type:complete